MGFLKIAAMNEPRPAEIPGSIRRLKLQEFDAIRRLAYQKFGLDLRNGKEELVAARLGKKIRQHGFNSFEEYYQHVVSDPSGEALIGMIDSLATNHTSFLREPAHFEFLRQVVLPELAARSHLDFWSAACSTGEEPYSLAFTLADQLSPASFSGIRILATDISTKVLRIAQRAVYPEERFQNFSRTWMTRYLLRGEGQWKGSYRVKPHIRSQVEFSRLNLIEPFPLGRLFSAIFCRNVMIYFDKPTQEKVIGRLSDCLEPGGYLFVGHAESLTGINHPLRYVRPAIYRNNGTPSPVRIP